MKPLTKKFVDEVCYAILGAAIEVHKTMGVGLYEEVYQYCMEVELRERGLRFERQRNLTILYKGHQIDTSLRYDLLVEEAVVVDLKSLLEVHPIFTNQMMTYMRLLQMPKGIIINFMCKHIFNEGQKTFVNELYRALPPK